MLALCAAALAQAATPAPTEAARPLYAPLAKPIVEKTYTLPCKPTDSKIYLTHNGGYAWFRCDTKALQRYYALSLTDGVSTWMSDTNSYSCKVAPVGEIVSCGGNVYNGLRRVSVLPVNFDVSEWSPDGQRLYAWQGDRVECYEPATGRITKMPIPDIRYGLMSMNPVDGTLYFGNETGLDSGDVMLEAHYSDDFKPLPLDLAAVFQALSPNARFVMDGASMTNAPPHLRDAHTGKLLKDFSLEKPRIDFVDWNPRYPSLMLLRHEDAKRRIYHYYLYDAALLRQVADLGELPAYYIYWSADGASLYLLEGAKLTRVRVLAPMRESAGAARVR